MMTKVKQYLQENGVDDTTDKAEIARLKKEFWKQERVRRNREYRTSRKEVRYSLPLSEWTHIESEARVHNMTVTEYAKKALLGYRDRTYVMPNIPALEELSKLVRNAATNINTAVQFMHLTRNYGESTEVLTKLQKELVSLLDLLKKSVEDKPELYTWLQEDLEQYPERLAWLATITKKIETDASS